MVENKGQGRKMHMGCLTIFRQIWLPRKTSTYYKLHGPQMSP